MGAFFLHPKETIVNAENIISHFKKSGFNKPLIADIGDYKLYLYRKQLKNIANHQKIDSSSIYVCGSLFYKNFGFRESLNELLIDFEANLLDLKSLFGNYLIIFYNSLEPSISLLFDPAFIKNTYFEKGKKLLSSNLLAIYESSKQEYTINEDAVIENLVTGHLISPDTYFNEVNRVDAKNYAQIEQFYPGIRIMAKTELPELHLKSRKQAIEHANDSLSHYFRCARPLCQEYGAHIGLTGGFDSRLLLMHARNKLTKLSTNSFWRQDSSEYRNAKKLADKARLHFNSYEENPFQYPGIINQLKQSLLFFDGQIRSQNYWIEEFNNPEYSKKMANDYYVGFHGCGGEQYRNADRFQGKMSLMQYIIHEWMFKQCENPFRNNNIKTKIYNRIEFKINRLVNIENDQIDLLLLKQIQNEIWNISNRATRLNVLNQQMFYFAPFTEASISHAAYHYVPFLGNSFDFQTIMMRNLDRELSGVMTNYGFTITNGESMTSKLIAQVINLAPRSLLTKIHSSIKMRTTLDSNFDSFDKEGLFFNRINQFVDLEKISKNKPLGKNLWSFNSLYNYFSI